MTAFHDYLKYGGRYRIFIAGVAGSGNHAGGFKSSESDHDDPKPFDDPITTNAGETWSGAGDNSITALATAKVHAGNDDLCAYGDATVFGGAGDDDIIAKNAGPTYGEVGDDTINADRGTNFGNDTLFGYWDADVYGGRGQ